MKTFALIVALLSIGLVSRAAQTPIKDLKVQNSLDMSAGRITNVVDILDTNGVSLLGGTGGNGSGNVTGPVSSQQHHLAAFANTSGQLLEDTGLFPWSFQATNANLTLWGAFSPTTWSNGLFAAFGSGGGGSGTVTATNTTHIGNLAYFTDTVGQHLGDTLIPFANIALNAYVAAVSNLWFNGSNTLNTAIAANATSINARPVFSGTVSNLSGSSYITVTPTTQPQGYRDFQISMTDQQFKNAYAANIADFTLESDFELWTNSASLASGVMALRSTNDFVTVGQGNVISNALVSIIAAGGQVFISGPFTNFSSETMFTNHGLGGIPTSVAAYIEFVHNDAGSGYRAGDWVKIDQSFAIGGSDYPSDAIWMNSTQVGINWTLDWISSGPTVVPKAGGTDTPIFGGLGWVTNIDVRLVAVRNIGGSGGGGSGTVTSVNVAEQGYSSDGPVTTSGTATLTQNADKNHLGFSETNINKLAATNSAMIGGPFIDPTNVLQVNTLGGAKALQVGTNAATYVNTLGIDQWQTTTNPANHSLVISNTIFGGNLTLTTNGVLAINGVPFLSANGLGANQIPYTDTSTNLVGSTNNVEFEAVLAPSSNATNYTIDFNGPRKLEIFTANTNVNISFLNVGTNHSVDLYVNALTSTVPCNITYPPHIRLNHFASLTASNTTATFHHIDVFNGTDPTNAIVTGGDYYQIQ